MHIRLRTVQVVLLSHC